MEHGVQFEVNGIRKHSSDWGLEFVSYALNFPEVKETYIDIEGANGSLDLTEAYGRIFYKNRKIVLNFNSKSGFDETIRQISTFLHGKVAKITLFDDDKYYYLGRVSFDKYSSDSKFGKVILNCECEPYKYKQAVSITTSTIKEKTVINYKSDRMESVPTFKADNDITFEWNGNSYALTSNQETIYPDIVFNEGDNIIVYNGNGIVEVSWQEGNF